MRKLRSIWAGLTLLVQHPMDALMLMRALGMRMYWLEAVPASEVQAEVLAAVEAEEARMAKEKA